jgi:hypothetical protein
MVLSRTKLFAHHAIVSVSSSIAPTSTLIAASLSADQLRVLRCYGRWQDFHDGPRLRGEPLLAALPRYPDAVLVAGCQRSGTTMLTRVIAAAHGFRRFELTKDDELDAALILAGQLRIPEDSRYCFQTTYLNEKVEEYRTLGAGQKLIWVLRNPHSVVYSMMKNWQAFGLDELYDGVVARRIRPSAKLGGSWWRRLREPSNLQKACAAYAAKTPQVLEIRRMLDPAQLLVIDYDEIVRSPAEWFSRIFSFIGEPYDPVYINKVRADSVIKARKMSDGLRQKIDAQAMPAYRRCLALIQRETT